MSAHNRLYGPKGRKVGPGQVLDKQSAPLISGGYPTSGGEMLTAMGRGIWAGGAGWLCEETSPNALQPVYGAPALVVNGAPNYRVAGPLGDFAVQTTADISAQNWSGGDVFDCTAADDILMAGVSRIDIVPAAGRRIYGKSGVAASYYELQINTGAGGGLSWIGVDGVAVTNWNAGATAAAHIGSWWCWVAAWERGAGANGQARICTSKNLGAAVNPTGAIGTLANAAGFGIGRPGSTTAGFSTAAHYVSVGPGVAVGCIANLHTMLASFQAYLGLP